MWLFFLFEEKTWRKVWCNHYWALSNVILARMTMSTDLLVICVARVAGDREVLQQVDAVIFIISTYSSFQQSLPVIVIPATPKDTAAISDLQTSFI